MSAPSDFAAIYDYVRGLPKGRVTSYGEVGAAVGAGARTVGWAMSAVPEDVPWQRVVGADGYLRIARRSPHLAELQIELLRAEGVVVSDKRYVERRFFIGYEEEEDLTAKTQRTQSSEIKRRAKRNLL